MLGCFTNSTSSNNSSDESLVINSKNVKLHAWLRRAASKVTVAFDGSNLKEGVFIYIQSVQIKDIPSQCYLGKDNNVGREGYTLDVPESGPEMTDGETITYHEGEHDSQGFEYGEGCASHRVTVGSPYLGSHAETAPALYFTRICRARVIVCPTNVRMLPGLRENRMENWIIRDCQEMKHTV